MLVRTVAMMPHMVHVDRGGNARQANDVGHAARQGRRLQHRLAVALKLCVVDRVEADHGDEQPNLSLGQPITIEKS